MFLNGSGIKIGRVLILADCQPLARLYFYLLSNRYCTPACFYTVLGTVAYLLLFLLIGITIPIIIANRIDVFQSTTAPLLSTSKFQSNVTKLAVINVITNVNNTFNKVFFVFIFVILKL